MGRYILCGKEADLPYEVDELDIRIYTIEELCYYIYNYLPLIGEDFIDERLLFFIRHELELPEIADKIERFYGARSEQDATLQMLLSDVGYFSDPELSEFQNRLVYRRRKSSQERIKMKGDSLLRLKRYQSAVRCYKTLAQNGSDSRVSREFYVSVLESLASAYGHLCEFDYALDCLLGIYDLNHSERILKKAYEVCILSGTELPQSVFSKVPDQKLQKWQQDYWNRDTIECTLATPEGRWIGKSSGSMRDLTVPLNENLLFPLSGTYHFEIEQAMREPVLKGISDIGLYIEKQ